MLCNQHAAARVDVKSARMNFPRLDVLDLRRLTGGLVERIHDNAVFAAFENLLALEVDLLLGAVRAV